MNDAGPQNYYYRMISNVCKYCRTMEFFFIKLFAIISNCSQRETQEEDWTVKASLPFSIIDGSMRDVSVDFGGALGWGGDKKLQFSLKADTGKTREVRPAYSGADKWPITVCSVQIFNKDFFGPIFFALCPQ